VASVIIDNLYVFRTGDRPAEADTILIVHTDAVLPRAVALERFKTVPRRNPKVGQPAGNLQLSQLPARDVLDALEPPDLPSFRQGFRISIAKRYDHRWILTRRTINVKRAYQRGR